MKYVGNTKELSRMLTLLSLFAILVGCTKSRDLEFADEKTATELFAINDLQDKEFTFVTGTDLSKPRVEGDKPQVKIESSDAPEGLRSLLAKGTVYASKGKSYRARLSVSKRFVTVTKIVEDESELTSLEKDIAVKEKSRYLVPMKLVRVKQYGVVERLKNENKELTSKLALKETAFDQATHIIVGLRAEDSTVPDIADDREKESIFSLAELRQTFTMETGQVVRAGVENSFRAINERPRVLVQAATVPHRLRKAVSAVPISGQPEKTYAIKFKLKKDGLKAYKVLDKESELSLLEAQNAVQEDGKFLVPINHFQVISYGILERATENRELTERVLLTPTDLARATHVKINLASIEAEESHEAKLKAEEDAKRLAEVFITDRFDQKVMTLSELKSQVNFGLNIQPEHAQAKVIAETYQMGGTKAQVNIMRIMKRSDLQGESRLLAKLENKEGIFASEIRYCEASIKSQLSKEEAADCILVLSYKVSADFVTVKTKNKELTGERLTGALEIEPIAGEKSVGFIRLAKDTEALAVGLQQLEDKNLINKDDIIGKEGEEMQFFLRRTLEDASSAIEVGVRTGVSGALESVKFQIKGGRLILRKVILDNGAKGTDLDKEELMSIPIEGYFAHNPQLGANKIVRTVESKAQYITLDWLKNTIPSETSPLSSYFGSGSCFKSVNDEKIIGMENNLHAKGRDKYLNFTIEGSYTFVPECMSHYWQQLKGYGMDYKHQSTFNIRERISIRLNDGSLDKTPSLDIPYNIQKMMGFGFFTGNRFKPDSFGNKMGEIAQRSQLATHDFSNGKQLVYHLGGLPSDDPKETAFPWMRKALIDETQNTIADWNKALHRAFKGTSLARSGDYIVLKIDGVDAKPGRVGDLNRNYIWNYDAASGTGLLGMAQSAQNPYSGKTEHANVLMYSGNLMSTIGYFKLVQESQKLYQHIKEQALAEINSEKTENPATTGKTGQASGSAGTASGASSRTQQKVFAEALINKMNLIANDDKPVTTVPLRLPLQKNLGEKISEIRDLQHTMSKIAKASSSKMNSHTQLGFISRIIDRALTMGAVGNEEMISVIAAQELARLVTLEEETGEKNQFLNLSAAEKTGLRSEAARLSMAAQFQAKFRAANGCMKMAHMESSLSRYKDVLTIDDEIIFRDIYKTTLAHELGHSLGLTHNFRGSVDERNFRFNDEKSVEEDPAGRNYSSVMDYMNDTEIRYAGPGPYDVRALRAGYTGLIDIDAQALIQNKLLLKDENTKRFSVAIANNKSIEMNVLAVDEDQSPLIGEIDLKKLKKELVGSKASWNSLEGHPLLASSVWNFQYCNDYDAGQDPLCQRWDYGTDPVQITVNSIENYKSSYALDNFRGARLRNSPLYSYIGRKVGALTQIRQIMDETFYQASKSRSEMEVLPYAIGALHARNFLLELYTTPTTHLPFSDTGRFFMYKFKGPVLDIYFNPELENDKPVIKEQSILVEAKPNKDILVPGTDEGYTHKWDTRGIEFDKVLALSMLMQRKLGVTRYARSAIQGSFVDFEKFFEMDTMVYGDSPRFGSATLNAVTEQISDQPTSVIYTSAGPLVLNSLEVSPQTTNLIKSFSVISPVLSLEANAIESKYNAAANFYVIGKSGEAPKDRPYITKLESPMNSYGALKFWAWDGATVMNELIRKALAQRIVIDNSEKLVKALTHAVSLKLAEKPDAEAQAKAKEELVNLVASLNNHQVLFAEGKNADDTKIRAMMEKVIAFTADLVKDLETIKANAVTKDQLMALLQMGSRHWAQERAFFEKETKNNVWLGLVQKMVVENYGAIPEVLQKVKTPEEMEKLLEGSEDLRKTYLQVKAVRAKYSNKDLENDYSLVVNSLEEISKVISWSHPELR